MGKRSSQRKNAAMMMTDSDRDDEESNNVSSWFEVVNVDQDIILDKALDALLDEKRGSTREKAFSLIIKSFINNNDMKKHHNKLVEKNLVSTLLHQCLLSIKKGSKKESSKETDLASRVIGLLALTVGFGDDAREIYDQSLRTLDESLTSGLDISSTSFLVRCLAIVTFVGVNNDQEKTQKSMDIMWRLINPKLGSNNVDSLVKPSPSLITEVVSSWSFLLSTMENLKLNPKTWQNPITYLSGLLDKQDRSVRIVAGEVLALIFEVGLIDESYVTIHGLKDKVINQVQNLTAEAGVKSCNKKDLKNQRDLFKDISGFFKNGFCPEITTKIGGGGGSVHTSSWSQMIQLNFFKHFLGGGFINHMKGNELLHHVFDYIPKRRNTENKIKSNKENTRFLNKQRKKRQESFLLECPLD